MDHINWHIVIKKIYILFDISDYDVLQALNNLGSVYVDCDKLDLAANCYLNALNIRHTRAHQGLARVYHLKSQRKAAYDEMTKLIEKARNNASAYEKRSEYCDRDMAKNDLSLATQLDPLRTYPYRYRAAGMNIYFFIGKYKIPGQAKRTGVSFRPLSVGEAYISDADCLSSGSNC